MAVLVYAESLTGSIKKAALEAVTYGKQTAAALGTECIALTIGKADDSDRLGKCGASKVYNVAASDDFDAQVYAEIIANAAKKLNADCVIFRALFFRKIISRSRSCTPRSRNGFCCHHRS